MERAEAALVAARRQGHPFSLCMIDIDHFKSINDTLGHGCGDEVLKEVARTCLAALREGEPLGRFGGEEFVVAIPGANLEQARRIAERLRKKVAELRFDGELSGRNVTVTIGVAEVRAHEAELEPALERADAALYRANGVVATMCLWTHDGSLQARSGPLHQPMGKRLGVVFETAPHGRTGRVGGRKRLRTDCGRRDSQGTKIDFELIFVHFLSFCNHKVTAFPYKQNASFRP